MYVRFARWRDKGVWEKVTGWLSANKRQVPHVRQRQVPLDSPFPRRPGPPAGHGREKNGDRAVGRRGGNPSQVHLSADGAGNGLGGALTPGPAGDCPEAEGLLRPWLAPTQEGVAAAADDRDALRELIARPGPTPPFRRTPAAKRPRMLTRSPTKNAILSSRPFAS